MSDSSIQVAIKIRPLIQREKEENLPMQWISQGKTIVATDAEIKKRGDGGFQFDHIFDMNSTNNDVFDTIVKPIVDAAVNGFNGTVFAYGQTSSGKTYTMMGTMEEPGVIPLAVEYMFDAISNTPGREFLLRVSYLEIYNEKVNDLLDVNNSDLKIHEDINNQVFVKCKEEVTNCPENVLSIMCRGNKNRRIGETNMNEKSSRSHTIFKITIESREAGADGAIQVSQLNMVDLAGSERMRQTGATGERFKEGRHINLSLSTLALVIKQLSESQDAQKFINFRDSKLTRLLQASLGGNAMTAIICAITPAALEETQCTLSFASRARNVKNKPQLNEVMSDGVLLKRYAKHIDALNAELERMKQLTGSTDLLEIESKMQEKDRINQNLENRIRLLQTRIVTSNNHNSESFKTREKRRRTWCGTDGYKSTFHSRVDLSPIKEMSPIKLHKSKSNDIEMNTSFEVAFEDFELELMKSEANREEESDDDDVFITRRPHNRVRFLEDVFIQKSPVNYDSRDTTPEKLDSYAQTTSLSPGTPRQVLQDRVRRLAEEYEELREYTTLEKQMYVDEHSQKLAKVSSLEKQLENTTCDKDAFEHIISDLRRQLTAAESRCASAEDQMNAQASELQRIPSLEKQIAELTAKTIEMQNISQLQKQINFLTAEKDGYECVAKQLRIKLNESEQRNILLEEKLQQVTSRRTELEEPLIEFASENGTTQGIKLETEIIAASEKNNLECKITELQNKLAEVEQCNSSLKDKLRERETELQDLGVARQQVRDLASEKDELQRAVCEIQQKLSEAEECNSSLKDKLRERETELQDLGVARQQVRDLASEKDELQRAVCEIQQKLSEAEQVNTSIRDKLSEQQLEVQKCQYQEKRIEQLMSEKREFELVIDKLKQPLVGPEVLSATEGETNEDQPHVDALQFLEEHIQNLPQKNILRKQEESKEKTNDSLTDTLTEVEVTNASVSVDSADDEVARLKNRMNDLECIIADIQKENKHLKEEALAKSAISNHEYDSINESSVNVEDMSSTKMSLDDTLKLSADLVLKTQQLDEMRKDVQSLKADLESLQETVYLLTTENSELASKLSAEKECAEKAAADFQQTIDDLYARNAKILDEKLNLRNNLVLLNDELTILRSKVSETTSSENERILKYEEQINVLTEKNAGLLSDIVDYTKELETLKESKSLVYEHDCMYKDKLTHLTDKHEYLTKENNELSTTLMDKIEESDRLKQECDILSSKLELSLRNNEDIGDVNDIEQLRAENTLLKTEMMELKANVKDLTDENSKLSNQLMETIEELEVQAGNSCNNTLRLSMLYNSASDTLDNSVNDNAEATILKLQDQVNHLTYLNNKLSELKLSPCIQCSHLKESNENRRLLKLQVKTLNHKLEDSQRRFDSIAAKSDALILKAREDTLNASACNTSADTSFSESMNVTFVEEGLQSLNNELQILKEDSDKLMNARDEDKRDEEKRDEEKRDEVENIQDSTVTNSSNDSSVSVKKSSRTSRLERIMEVMSVLQSDFNELKENNVNVKENLAKFIAEKESLLDEINILRAANEQLLQQLSESKLSHKTALEKAIILESEITDVTDKLEEITARCKQIEDAKLLLDIEAGSLKEDKIMKEQTINELRQSVSCLQHEVELMKSQKEELDVDNNNLKQEYEETLKSLRSANEELTNSKAIISQKLADSKIAEDRVTELNEKVNKISSENDYLKEELIKLRNIEEKFEKIKTEYQSKHQQDQTLIEDNKKLKNLLNNASKNIIKEIISLKPKADTQELANKSADDLFQVFVQTILAKETEIVKTMQENFDKTKRKLEDEKRQSVDAEKRTASWAKELEGEIEKLQADLSERETATRKLQEEVARLEQLLKESDCDRFAMKEKIGGLETDLGNLQTELDKYSKNDTVNGEAVIIAQKREKQAQEVIKNKEAEFQAKLNSEREVYNKRIEDLACTIESFKTKTIELTGNVECLEANQKQLKNIIELKSNEIMKSNQIIQTKQTELEQLAEAYADLNRELEEKNQRIAEITERSKFMCDELTECRASLDVIVPENEFLKQQINERKVAIEQYKKEMEKLKMEDKKEIDAIRDKLNFEELKNAELNKQIADLNNNNVALTDSINNLINEYAMLERKCCALEKRVRNSTSKILAEEQMEELKDLNRSLRNNLDGASNRITELQAAKTDLMKQLVVLNSQYDTACKENQTLKETLSSYRCKYDTNDDKYDALLQEKNKVALELEATKVRLAQASKDIEIYTEKIKELEEKVLELDKEAEDLANVIREHDAENARLQDQYYTCRDEIDKLQNKIKSLEKEDRDEEDSQSPSKTNESSDRVQRSSYYDECCRCKILQNTIRKLELELVSKNGKITTLELQIRSGSFPYQKKCKELQEHLLAYKNKNSELSAEIKRLQIAMLRTSARECDVCKQRLVNRRHQSCQTVTPIRFCGTSSGIIDDEVRILKLEKEKQMMKDVCRSRAKVIKELEQRIKVYENELGLGNA
ncbi:centromere-associated protein E-like isoform X2 [Pseudomyrmex gracilis]|uniref:centromere-associated protein E-like isoform X2 n=1 Tax=Pseudomyrmex gracilis TaxID=219809 RepID=UPI0009953E85|nr:centromere-associated protein E-like isoform X2 [Pseudomyrmex gracilis]